MHLYICIAHCYAEQWLYIACFCLHERLVWLARKKLCRRTSSGVLVLHLEVLEPPSHCYHHSSHHSSHNNNAALKVLSWAFASQRLAYFIKKRGSCEHKASAILGHYSFVLFSTLYNSLDTTLRFTIVCILAFPRQGHRVVSNLFLSRE